MGISAKDKRSRLKIVAVEEIVNRISKLKEIKVVARNEMSETEIMEEIIPTAWLWE